MSKDIPQDIQNGFNKETDTGIYFYTPTFYCFDNFSAFTVHIWGTTFLTAEHAYQWKKYHQVAPDIAQQILEAQSPNAVKNISDAYKDLVPQEFTENKVEYMREILQAKISQHPKVEKMLKLSGTKEIIENSPTDTFWGIADGSGENHLGKIWMALRNTLQ